MKRYKRTNKKRDTEEKWLHFQLFAVARSTQPLNAVCCQAAVISKLRIRNASFQQWWLQLKTISFRLGDVRSTQLLDGPNGQCTKQPTRRARCPKHRSGLSGSQSFDAVANPCRHLHMTTLTQLIMRCASYVCTSLMSPFAAAPESYIVKLCVTHKACDFSLINACESVRNTPGYFEQSD